MNDYELSGFVSVICYIHNEGEHLRRFSEAVIRKVHSVYRSCEIIFINDASDTETHEKIDEIEKELPDNIDLTVIDTDRFSGIDECLYFAMKYSIGDYVIEFDSPSYDDTEKVLDDLINGIRQGHDAILSVPNSESVGFRVLKLLCNSNLGSIYDSRAGIFSRRFVNKIYDIHIRSGLMQVLYQKIGYAVCCVPCPDKVIQNDVKQKRRGVFWKTILLYSPLYRYIVLLEILLVVMTVVLSLVFPVIEADITIQIMGVCFILFDLFLIGEYKRFEGVERQCSGKCKGWMIHKTRGR